MADYSNIESAERSRKHRPAGDCHSAYESGDHAASPGSTLNPSALLRAESIVGRGNSAARAGTMQAMQRTHGNRAVQRFVQRSAPQQAVQVQRFGLDGLWDPVKKGGSAAWEAMQNVISPAPNQLEPLLPVGPVIMPDNIGTPVGPVMLPDNIETPEMVEEWPESDSWA